MPTLGEYIEKATGKSPEGPLWDLIMYHAQSSAPVNWIIVAPPGTPQDHLDMLRASFDEATASPEYLEAATKVYGSPPNIVHWQEMTKIISDVQNTSEDIKDTMRQLVERIEQ